MSTCETCGNQYEHAITVRVGGKEHEFDCFECAIHALAPRCNGCGVTVLGHGVEAGDIIHCSAHCAGKRGEIGICDHVGRLPGASYGNLISFSTLRHLASAHIPQVCLKEG